MPEYVTLIDFKRLLDSVNTVVIKSPETYRSGAFSVVTAEIARYFTGFHQVCFLGVYSAIYNNIIVVKRVFDVTDFKIKLVG